MSGSEAHLAAITEDLACPTCGYNLRGLVGNVVTCPECGHRVDRAKLAAARWARPWYRAPGLMTLQWPVAVAFGSAVFMPVIAALPTGNQTTFLYVIILVPVVSLALWTLLMVRAVRYFRRLEGVWLALLMHVLFAGYFVCFVGGFLFCFAAAVRAFGMPNAHWTAGVVSLIAGLALITFGALVLRRIERFIAARCIRRHLELASTVASTPGDR